ncbi:unnamed protein product [Miscanthus lutarioriparius]|uniref:Uncharacterized protein n=1 Tax=Miscanthus lutarioriparius TaxID=422564 RepID=A0A811RHD4_9POAL|nr:unnamed protein product [Miscanthus lutarioriparius]
MALHAALWMHVVHYPRRRLSSPPLLLVACLAVLVLPQPMLSRTAAATSTVVTHLPGFDGPLPFYLETGYVGIEKETGAELFYYFVESERSPRTDPLLLWLTGGPRCSVLSALAFQIGPLKFVVEPYDGTLPRLVYNPYSWTQMASILFLDSPVGSGFSYAHDPKAYEVGDISSSRQVLTFLRKLMSEVYVMNILQPTCHIPSRKQRGTLEGLLSLAEEHYHYQLSGAPDEPPFDCFYDYRYYLSYFWANDNAVGAALGVKEGTVTEWIRCKSPPVLPYACDLPSSIKYFFNLSIRGYRALVYSGDHDLVVPFSGTQAWTRSFNFSIVDDWRAWHLDNQAAGLTSLVVLLHSSLQSLYI